MGDVVARATQPALAAIKLAWWRERLEELDEGIVPAEPRLRAVASHLVPIGVLGADLAQLEAGWAGFLQEPPDVAAVSKRGTCLFELAARILNLDFDDQIGPRGRLFSGVDAGRRGLMDLAAGSPGSGGPRTRRAARPLTALAALAARDLRRGGPPFEPEGTPGRAWTVFRHWLTGRL